ncbi:unknown protein [Paenibacillus amylolyticus]|uniref:Uncharacterized protein n=1 Tax=Paenibacillus amylolyticus TaxID=1451 RepID=A0A124DX72_PAEAM|nr:unknown protein [Paenibacillus amylolyticus]
MNHMEIEKSEGQGVSRRTLCHEGKQRTSNEHVTSSIGTKHSTGFNAHKDQTTNDICFYKQNI